MTESMRLWKTLLSGVIWALLVTCLAWSETGLTAKAANLVLVEGGAFTMGDTIGNGFDDEKPLRRVTISSFYLGKYEVTFAEYDAFCAATGRKQPDDAGWGRGTRPVINIILHDVISYCNWRSRQEGLKPAYSGSGDTVICDFSANGYRLPTEAEWEYAAKGGQNSRGYLFSGSNNIYAVAWFQKNSGDMTQPVGQKQPNELGLYDMTGNVWEWCWDWHGVYQPGDCSNPRGPRQSVYRITRGGSWFHAAVNARVSYRFGNISDSGNPNLGFRLLRTP